MSALYVVPQYYGSIESRFVYWLFLGNTRHCGLYATGRLNPFPLSRALRDMEDKVYSELGLSKGSRVLDAGAGSGHVAIHLARKGLNVQAIDITPHHLQQAVDNVKAAGLQDKVSVAYADFHDLSAWADGSFDGIYAMETFCHADNAAQVLAGFHRLLRPGGVLLLHDMDFVRAIEESSHNQRGTTLQALRDIVRLWHLPSAFRQGRLEELIGEAGFVEIQLVDMTKEVLPMWRFLSFMAYVPYRISRLLGFQDSFSNVMAAVELYAHSKKGNVRYIAVTAKKPPAND